MEDTLHFKPREVSIRQLADGHFRLVECQTTRAITPIAFNNRKAARNWAAGRGFLLVGEPEKPEPGIGRN
ncbi:MAG: hypothetical protein EA425_13715 [Puniceicoccaceae bacterium]|nr:MAG: hypothetical protein EA425_13715 [Puniceicoccaceae bacterium]